MMVRVQEADFDVGAELAALRRDEPQIGALVLRRPRARCQRRRRGLRDDARTLPRDDRESACSDRRRSRQRWKLIDAMVIHRVGRLLPGDQIVLVAVAGAHRGEAFAACEFIMDYLKTRAPFWKREVTPQGARWVAARASDDQAAERWQGRSFRPC
jgi:molybdopterin synthase catalytic subunit